MTMIQLFNTLQILILIPYNQIKVSPIIIITKFSLIVLMETALIMKQTLVHHYKT